MGPDTSDILNCIYVVHKNLGDARFTSLVVSGSSSSFCIIMGRAAGAKNYKKDVLLEVVKEVLPSGAYEWERVCALYKERSGESDLRDKDDVKRHWIEKMCYKFKKPTGNAGAASDFIRRCQKVQALIHKKCESTLMGSHSMEDSDHQDSLDGEDSEDEDKSVGEEDGGQDTVIPALPPFQEGEGGINDVEEVVADSPGAKEPETSSVGEGDPEAIMAAQGDFEGKLLLPHKVCDLRCLSFRVTHMIVYFHIKSMLHSNQRH